MVIRKAEGALSAKSAASSSSTSLCGYIRQPGNTPRPVACLALGHPVRRGKSLDQIFG